MSDLPPNDPPWHGQLRFVIREEVVPNTGGHEVRKLRLLQVYEQRRENNDPSSKWVTDWYDVPLDEQA